MNGTIGLIAAMGKESQALLRRVKGWKRTRLAGLPGASFTLAGNTCVLVTSGMGVRRAGLAAQALVDQYAPTLFISFGIAGAVEPGLDIGDVVLAESFCQFEQGLAGPLTRLGSWPETARKAAEQALAGSGKHLYTGVAVTTHGSQPRQDQLLGLAHPVLEMETAGLAQVASQSGVQLFSLRAISDGPGAPIPLDLAEVMDEDANLKVGQMVRVLLRTPHIIRPARQMLVNSAMAAESAALALVAALGKWSG